MSNFVKYGDDCKLSLKLVAKIYDFWYHDYRVIRQKVCWLKGDKLCEES